MQVLAVHAPLAIRSARGLPRRRHGRALRATPPEVPGKKGPAWFDPEAAQLEPVDRERFDAETALLVDIERLNAKKTAERMANVASNGGVAAEEGPGMKEQIDAFLVKVFFFVVFAFVWLGAGVAVQMSTENTIVMDAWLGLWPLVFQPAIGVLMLASLVSGGYGWAKENKYIQ